MAILEGEYAKVAKI